jgi:hypothetical protein
MNNKYTFNKYSNFPATSIYNDILIEEKQDLGYKYLEINGLEKYICGNINKKIKLERENNNIKNKRIKVLDNPFSGQLYFDSYYKNPINPMNQNDNAIEKWQKNQPLSYNINIEGEYPIGNLNDKLINKYDNSSMYSSLFFYQNDATK